MFFCNLFGKENIVPLKISATSGTKKWHEDDNHSFGRGKQDEAHTWSNISKEADALIWLNKNAPGSSSHYAYPVADKPQKGDFSLFYDFLSLMSIICLSYVFSTYLQIEFSGTYQTMGEVKWSLPWNIFLLTLHMPYVCLL